MFGTIWMFSDQIDDEDLLFAMKDFVTIKLAREYYEMSYNAVIHAADKAGAFYKLHKKVLISREILEDYSHFKNVVFSLASDLPSPRKEYWRILSLTGNGANVPKTSRSWLYKTYDECIKTASGLKDFEKNRIRGLVLGALTMDYRYFEANEMASRLLEQEDIPAQAYYNLADFFSKTRRYDEADEAISNGVKKIGDQSPLKNDFVKLNDDTSKRRNAEQTGNREYVPQPSDAKIAYAEFLASIGIQVETSTSSKGSRYPTPIPKDQYPKSKETRDADFDTFVAYDVETTGKFTRTDSMIEIGAVKVVNGEVIESKEYTFQELVKPFKSKVSEEITALTGLAQDDVVDARQMWEVFPDFVEFIGDSILVGHNNIRFDSKFLERAGRYSHIEISNLQFDVQRYAQSLDMDLGGKYSLESLAERLGIENPQAHRALSDAITTAKVFLKLKEQSSGVAQKDIDSILEDIDEW